MFLDAIAPHSENKLVVSSDEKMRRTNRSLTETCELKIKAFCCFFTIDSPLICFFGGVYFLCLSPFIYNAYIFTELGLSWVYTSFPSFFCWVHFFEFLPSTLITIKGSLQGKIMECNISEIQMAARSARKMICCQNASKGF